MLITSVRLVFVLCLAACTFQACNTEPQERGPATPANQKVERSLPALRDVTASSGLASFRHDNGARGEVYFPELMGSGGGFIDFDGDNWPDILLVGGGVMSPSPQDTTPALRLLKNNWDGTFSDATDAAGLADVRAYGQGIVAADYDNDGDEDFYLTTLDQNILFKNENGRFTSEQSVVTATSEWSSSALFFDADLDGDLDLFVANYVDWAPERDIFCSIQGIVIVDTRGTKNLEEQYGQKVYCPPSEFAGLANNFYRNTGNGTFIDETEATGFRNVASKTLGVVTLDYNRDGWPDLVVTNDAQPDFLYKNNGDGTFTEIGERSGIALGEMGNARAGMGVDAGVVDKSGQESIFVGNFSSEMIGVYKYTGNDQFQDRAAASKIGQPSYLTLTFGLFLFDIEYDGDLDLLAANGHVWAIRPTLDGSTYRQKPQLFVNNGDGLFTLATSPAGGVLNQELVARGASYADFDRDGDLDILFTENGGRVHLWRNELSNANYLRVQLKGNTSNREGLGAQISILVDGEKQYRRMRTGASYLSQSEKVVSFGLNNNTMVDSLVVHWPSGQVDRFADVPGNQQIKVTEGSQQVEPMARQTAETRATSPN